MDVRNTPSPYVLDRCRVWRETWSFAGTSPKLYSGSWSNILWNGVTFDSNNMHNIAANQSRITAKTAGIYIVSASMMIAKNGNGIRYMRLKKNGSEVAGANIDFPSPTYDTMIVANTIIDLAVDDYMEVTCWQNSGSTLDLRIYEWSSYLAVAQIC